MRMMLLTLAFISIAYPAAAYIGPGAGLGAIGVLLGIVLSVFLAVFAVVWYPVKRLMRRRRTAKTQASRDRTQPARDH